MMSVAGILSLLFRSLKICGSRGEPSSEDI